MKNWSAALLCIAFLGSATAQQLSTPMLASELAAAMRLDEQIAADTNHVAAELHRRNQSSPERIACAASLFTPREFTDDARTILAGMFTPQELATGLNFYRSPSGQRWVEWTYDVLRASHTGAKRTVKLTRQESADVKAFEKTELGLRMTNIAKITSSPEASQILGPKAFSSFSRCPKQPGGH